MRKEPAGRLALERRLLGTEETLWACSPLGFLRPGTLTSGATSLPPPTKIEGGPHVRGPLLPPAPFATPVSGRKEAQEAL